MSDTNADNTNLKSGSDGGLDSANNNNNDTETVTDIVNAAYKNEILQLATGGDDVDGDVDPDDSPQSLPQQQEKPSNVGSYRVVGYVRTGTRDAAADAAGEDENDNIDDTGDGGDGDLEQGGIATSTTATPQTSQALPSSLEAQVTAATAATNTATTTTTSDNSQQEQNQQQQQQQQPIAEAVTVDDLVEKVRAQLLSESIRATEVVVDPTTSGTSGTTQDAHGRSGSTVGTGTHPTSAEDTEAGGAGSNDGPTSSSVGTQQEQPKNRQSKTDDDDVDKGSDNKNNKMKIYVFAAVAVVLIIVAVVIGVVVSSNDSSSPPSSSSSSSTTTTTTTTSNTTNDDGAIDSNGSGFVYIINMKDQAWCGHNDHTARFCGGHLASVLNPEEKQIVDDLTQIAIQEAPKWNITWLFDIHDDERHIFYNQPLGMKGTWIGGRQSLFYHNDTPGSDVLDVYHYGENGTVTTTWEWADYSGPWFDGDVDDGAPVGSYWAPGQPDNSVYLAALDKNRTFGEDALFLGEDGFYYDLQNCQGFTTFNGPGILRLPVDYNDRTKYPDCKNSEFFLTDHQVPAPPRPVQKAKYVYALDMNPTDHCNARDRARWCGGHLASITSEEELVLVYQLAFRAHFYSPRDARFGAIGRIFSVWLGGMIDDSSDGWYWTDGSRWYDDDGDLFWSTVEENITRSYGLRISSNTVHNDADYIQKYLPWRFDDEMLLAVYQSSGQNITTFVSEGGQACVGDWRTPTLNDTAAIYRLPADYSDQSKYPSCQLGDFDYVFPAPDRV